LTTNSVHSRPCSNIRNSERRPDSSKDPVSWPFSRTIHGDQGQGHVVEGVGAQFRAAADLLQFLAVDLFQPEAETLGHLQAPLLQQGAGRGDDQDAVGQPSGDEFGDDQAGLDGLAQANAVGQEEAGPAHLDGPEDRDELVGLDAQSAGLNGEEGGGPEGLFQEESLVVDQPVGEGGGPVAFRLQVVADRLHGLEGVKEVKLLAQDGVFDAAQAEESLLAQVLGGDDLPAQAAGRNLRTGEQVQRIVHRVFRTRAGPVQSRARRPVSGVARGFLKI
jgi:hypothetical protein